MIYTSISRESVSQSVREGRSCFSKLVVTVCVCVCVCARVGVCECVTLKIVYCYLYFIFILSSLSIYLFSFPLFLLFYICVYLIYLYVHFYLSPFSSSPGLYLTFRSSFLPSHFTCPSLPHLPSPSPHWIIK